MIDDNPFDPFADIDLDGFEPSEVDISTKEKVENSFDKKKIQEIAQAANFHSRPSPVIKEKIFPKTFSLFRSECEVINSVIQSYLGSSIDNIRPSGSDVVRAALHYLSTCSVEEQIKLVQQHRGRGRK